MVVVVHEDRAGNIWVGSESTKVVYWSRSEQKFIGIVIDGVARNACAFGEDGAGDVWIGDEAGQLWRVRNSLASKVAGLGTAWIRGILLDHTGRLWVATSNRGLFRFDKPTEPAPRFQQYSYSDGLSCLMLRGLAEDRNGAIYIASLDGVDRLDPDLGHIRHYSSADGIAPGNVFAAHRDRQGVMWFATNHGLTRLVPQNNGAGNPPVWITGVTIAGHHAQVSEVGESSIRGIVVQPAQEHLQFDFVGLSYSAGHVLRYQYRLGDGDWSTPIAQRSIHYAALAPGQHRFEVRAVNSDGEASVAPATVEFQVAPPLWRRAWFQGILLSIAIAGAVWLHRARVARLIEIERVRMRIATDLHDDIGSSCRR
jgi:hypothetical protein